MGAPGLHGPGTPAVRGRVLSVLCVGMFLMMLDVTVVNLALPRIAADVGGGVEGTQWIVDAYVVVLAGSLLGGGVLGDRLGHRRVVVGGLCTFGVASVVCSAAPTLLVLLLGRALQGLGAALFLPGSAALVVHLYDDPSDRARAFGIWAGASSLALPIGPLLGGALVERVGWWSVFALAVPVVAIAVPALLRWAPTEAAGADSRARPLDSVSLVALPTVVAAAVAGIIELPAHPVIAALLLLVVLPDALVVLVVRQRWTGAQVLPWRSVARPHVTAWNLVALMMNALTNGTLYCTALLLQVVHGATPERAGRFVLGLFLGLVVLSPIAGRLSGRFGPRVPAVAGALVAACAQASFIWSIGLPGARGTGAHIALSMGALGIGIGLLTAPVVGAAVAALPLASAGVAGGLNNAARQCGTALGVAVMGAIVGDPRHGVAFVERFRVVVGAAAGGWLLCLLLLLALGRGLDRH